MGCFKSRPFPAKKKPLGAGQGEAWVGLRWVEVGSGIMGVGRAVGWVVDRFLQKYTGGERGWGGMWVEVYWGRVRIMTTYYYARTLLANNTVALLKNDHRAAVYRPRTEGAQTLGLAVTDIYIYEVCVHIINS